MIRETKAYDCTCDVCGYVWFCDVPPSRCANQKCKSRRWNAGEKAKPEPEKMITQAEEQAKPEPEPEKKPVGPVPSCPRCQESGQVSAWGSGHRCRRCELNF